MKIGGKEREAEGCEKRQGIEKEWDGDRGGSGGRGTGVWKRGVGGGLRGKRSGRERYRQREMKGEGDGGKEKKKHGNKGEGKYEME